MMAPCKRDALLGCAWCRRCLKRQLEAARRLLKIWRILSTRQNAIVMAKINRTIERMQIAELEAYAERADREGGQ